MNDKKQLAAMGEHLAEQQQPLRMAKRIEELEGQVLVMAELLRDLHEHIGTSIPQTVSEHYRGCDLLERIDAALAGNVPDHFADVTNMVELDAYDAGHLNDYGGGNVGWWHDYIRSELDRAHDFYQSQFGEGNHIEQPLAMVRNGWQMVPVEITSSMWDAVNKLDDAMYAGGDHYGASIEQCWECLLAAAPKPEAK